MRVLSSEDKRKEGNRDRRTFFVAISLHVLDVILRELQSAARREQLALHALMGDSITKIKNSIFGISLKLSKIKQNNFIRERTRNFDVPYQRPHPVAKMLTSAYVYASQHDLF